MSQTDRHSLLSVFVTVVCYCFSFFCANLKIVCFKQVCTFSYGILFLEILFLFVIVPFDYSAHWLFVNWRPESCCSNSKLIFSFFKNCLKPNFETISSATIAFQCSLTF